MTAPTVSVGTRTAFAGREAEEPGRHWLDRRSGERQGELARARALGLTRPEGPGAAAMAKFRETPKA